MAFRFRKYVSAYRDVTDAQRLPFSLYCRLLEVTVVCGGKNERPCSSTHGFHLMQSSSSSFGFREKYTVGRRPRRPWCCYDDNCTKNLVRGKQSLRRRNVLFISRMLSKGNVIHSERE